jgi:hypothetical protein
MNSEPPRPENDSFDLKSTKTKNQQTISYSNKNYLNSLKNFQTPQAVIKLLKTNTHSDKNAVNYILNIRIDCKSYSNKETRIRKFKRITNEHGESI